MQLGMNEEKSENENDDDVLRWGKNEPFSFNPVFKLFFWFNNFG